MQETTELNYGFLDVIGLIYDNVNDEPVQRLGWHVNSPYLVQRFHDKLVHPSTPRRVFAGGNTYHYTFVSEAEFLEMLSEAELIVPQDVPPAVTRRQARQALMLAGLLDKVQPAINAIPNVTQRALVQIEWDDSQTFERNRPVLISLGTALGMTSADLDNLFIQASKL